tara:strand:+ start:9259 stop:9735 length:477 start_codon:yes stop_codon:yes gene_type:complete
MSSLSAFVKKHKPTTGEAILSILFIVFLIMGYDTPKQLSDMLNTVPGQMVLLFVVVYIFLNFSSVLAVLSLLVAVDLIRRSSYTSEYDRDTNLAGKFQPSEESKKAQFTVYNQFPYTLEQEVIKKMVPTFNPGSSLSKPSYKPTLENLHSASYVDATN